MKLITVSNRLPLSVREEAGELRFAESPGGLASGLRNYLNSPRCDLGEGYTWIGWPGTDLRPELRPEVERRCREEFSSRPVFLSAAETEAFYEGLCNRALWPLFHYFPERVIHSPASWEAYCHANRVFRDAVLEEAGPDDIVWVHDYHFLLLPALLREKRPDIRVGFFLHIPFPSFELFRLLPAPWRVALLEGLLGADLVGFHTHDFARHFLACVRRILGRDHEMGRVFVGGRAVRADTFPMGVDFDSFSSPADEAGLSARRDEFSRTLGGCKAVLSIDRLDYTKGIADRLRAFAVFLEGNPDWHGKVVLVMIVVPSRTGVSDYRAMKSKVDELVGDINGRFGTLSWTPVVYQYKSFPQQDLVPLYRASDVMLVTPLRDGMNLVAKEYVASRSDGDGVLVLSEMAGAASELGEALVVNPHDSAGVAEALRTALEMPEADRRTAMRAMRERVRRYDAARWAGEFLGALREDNPGLDRRALTVAARKQLVEDFRKASRRLLLLDYDGTLVPLRPTPAAAMPDAALGPLLVRLANGADVAVVSSRPREELEAWFGSLPVTLAAEHGAWMRPAGGEWSKPVPLTAEWKPKVREVMEAYVGRLPGSFVEEKEFTVAWHFRRSDPDLAELRARELADHLIGLTEAGGCRVVEGMKVIEVRPASVGKGVACGPLLEVGHDFILAMGDDTTDEDLFRVLPEGAYSVRVGRLRSSARFHVPGQGDARRLVEELAAALAPR